MSASQKIPLRERKHAQTRLKLSQAMVAQLETQPLEALSVRGLCEAAEVSEATFFNYFPRKADLVAYVSALWALEVAWQVSHAGTRGLAAVGVAFDHAARQIQRHPGVMGEIIAYQARLRERPEPPGLSRAERLLAYPDLPGIEDVPPGGLEGVLVPNLQHAIDTGELPSNTHLPTVMVSLAAVFHGVPLALGPGGAQGVGSRYRQQLALLWAGVRAMAGP